tara:strand:+ start:400 stop:1956 length:1557 start_codon:yes stop_codon:yes gene_type:complete
MKTGFINKLKSLILFFPILIYFGKRSYLAYDEGFYALQAKWILNNNNWVIPAWWDEYNLDRTIGIQYLIAKSQSIFGETVFAAHIPTTVAAFIMLLVTYKLHQELLGSKEAIFSSLILSTTYIWFDFAHLATQDMVFACLITIGLYSLIRIEKDGNIFFHSLFGTWIGLAFMMKTFLIVVPLIGLFPYILEKRKDIIPKYFFIGLILGFSPFIFWATLTNQYLEKNIIFHLFDKFSNLSTNNTFTHPFYYYLWNIPLNFLPWSFFCIFGLINNFKISKKNRFTLCYFPLVSVLTLSIFSTKTPYYSLQLASVFSINAYSGIKLFLSSKRLKKTFLLIISKICPFLIYGIIFIYFFVLKKTIFLSIKEELLLLVGLILLATFWLSINKIYNRQKIIIFLIIGPYLLTACTIQSGLFTDRSKEIRESMENIITSENLNEKIINVNKNSILDSNAHSKIIRISLLTPKLGRSVNSFHDLEPSEFIWIDKSNLSDIEDKTYKVIVNDKNLKPWMLVKKLEHS